jgi:hypothetical protein
MIFREVRVFGQNANMITAGGVPVPAIGMAEYIESHNLSICPRGHNSRGDSKRIMVRGLSISSGSIRITKLNSVSASSQPCSKSTQRCNDWLENDGGKNVVWVEMRVWPGATEV